MSVDAAQSHAIEKLTEDFKMLQNQTLLLVQTCLFKQTLYAITLSCPKDLLLQVEIRKIKVSLAYSLMWIILGSYLEH